MISVIVPVYNAAAYIAETLQSVQSQTFTDWEIVVVDDGSKDNSLAIAEEFGRQDRRISVHSQPNSGVSTARNLGLAKSRSDFPYALFLDSDDLLTPAALQTLLTLLEAHPEACAACGFLQDIDAKGQATAEYERLESLIDRRGVEGLRLVQRKPDAPVVFGDVCFHCHIITPGQVLVRKTALAKVGGFEAALAYVEDYDLWWRLTMQVGPIATTPKKTLLYRHHGTSISGNSAVRRRGAADFRWRLLTYPGMTSEQRKIARRGYAYHCVANLGFGVYYLRRGEVKHGLKHAALGVRDMLYYLRDLVRLQRQPAPTQPAPR